MQSQSAFRSTTVSMGTTFQLFTVLTALVGLSLGHGGNLHVHERGYQPNNYVAMKSDIHQKKHNSRYVCKPSGKCDKRGGTCQEEGSCPGPVRDFCKGNRCECCLPVAPTKETLLSIKTEASRASTTEPEACQFGNTTYPNEDRLGHTCMILKCNDGSWDFIKMNPACNISCLLTGDPHIETFELNTNNEQNTHYTYHGNGQYALTQPGLVNVPLFGVNGVFEDCMYGKTGIACVKGVIFFEPGVKITMMDMHYPGIMDQVMIAVNGSPYILGNNVDAIVGSNGVVVLLFRVSSLCINILGSKGLSVQFCKTSPYNSLEIWAIGSLKAVPTSTQTSDQLYGLCDQYTVSGQKLNYYTTRSGAHSVNSTQFADTWKVI